MNFLGVSALPELLVGLSALAHPQPWWRISSNVKLDVWIHGLIFIAQFFQKAALIIPPRQLWKINAINFACKCWVRRKKNQTNKRTIFYFLDWSLPPTLLPISNHTNSSELKSQSKKYWLCSTYAFPAVEDNLRTHLNTNLPLKTSFCFEVPVLCCKGCSLRDQLVYNQK